MRHYWTLIRPFTMAAPVVGIISGAMLAAGHIAAEPWVLLSDAITNIMYAVLSAAFLNSASNCLNQITDLEIDRLNKPDRPIPSDNISVGSAAVLSMVLYLFALLTATLVQPHGSNATFYIVLAGALLTVIYSVPPLRTKRDGTLANLTIALARGLLLPVCGWSAVASIQQPEPWIISSTFAIFIFGAATTKDFSDVEGDENGHCKTWVVKYGKEKAARLIRPFLVCPWILLAILWVTPDFFPLLPGANIPLALGLSCFLAAYGIRIGSNIQKDVLENPIDGNHPSWKHIYFQYQVALIGTPLVYLL